MYISLHDHSLSFLRFYYDYYYFCFFHNNPSYYYYNIDIFENDVHTILYIIYYRVLYIFWNIWNSLIYVYVVAIKYHERTHSTLFLQIINEKKKHSYNREFKILIKWKYIKYIYFSRCYNFYDIIFCRLIEYLPFSCRIYLFGYVIIFFTNRKKTTYLFTVEIKSWSNTILYLVHYLYNII